MFSQVCAFFTLVCDFMSSKFIFLFLFFTFYLFFSTIACHFLSLFLLVCHFFTVVCHFLSLFFQTFFKLSDIFYVYRCLTTDTCLTPVHILIISKPYPYAFCTALDVAMLRWTIENISHQYFKY